ncbi:MAG: fatty acid desaturase family protein [Synechococcaceae cyanobacterium]
MINPVEQLDYEALALDLDALFAEAKRELGDADLLHMKKMICWGRICTILGYGTAWILPNPVSMLLIAQGATARWAIVAHHVLHGGLEKLPNTPKHLTRRGFAVGIRRPLDWMDWMLPEAWRYEHSVFHHYHTNEPIDPDLVEQNVQALHSPKIPLSWRYIALVFFAFTWKLSYYAPNTFRVLQRANQAKSQGKSGLTTYKPNEASYAAVFDFRHLEGRNFWRICLLPYVLYRFLLIPMLFLPLGSWASFCVVLNSLGAELFHNLYTFFLIVPNHAGDDVHRFQTGITDRTEFYVRQILGTVNYSTGGDIRDFLHGFLNYQIEHHLWPELPPLAYQRLQPKVKSICLKHGVPYIQEPVWKRGLKLIDIIVGKSRMINSSTLKKSERPSKA